VSQYYWRNLHYGSNNSGVRRYDLANRCVSKNGWACDNEWVSIVTSDNKSWEFSNSFGEFSGVKLYSAKILGSFANVGMVAKTALEAGEKSVCRNRSRRGVKLSLMSDDKRILYGPDNRPFPKSDEKSRESHKMRSRLQKKWTRRVGAVLTLIGIIGAFAN
jgi:hypothetical protein